MIPEKAAKLCVVLCAVIALSGCAVFGKTPVYGEIPECELLVPPSLKAAVPGVGIPQAQVWPDGHEKAGPWQEGFLGQTGQLEKANEKPAAVDFIYHNCLELNRRALARTKRGFFGRLFG